MDKRKPVLYTTHDYDEVIESSNKIAIIENGIIVEKGLLNELEKIKDYK